MLLNERMSKKLGEKVVTFLEKMLVTGFSAGKYRFA
jgi:hypothetical protein